MADAEKDIIGPGEDLVRVSDGGGPFQTFDDVPGVTSKASAKNTCDDPDMYKGKLQEGQGKQIGLGGADKDNLAGR